MAPQPTTAGDMLGREKGLFDRLLALYTHEQRIYREVLELSRQQGDIVASKGSIEQVRRLLERKNACLEAIRHLEGTEQEAKAAWEAGRDGWSAAARAGRGMPRRRPRPWRWPGPSRRGSVRSASCLAPSLQRRWASGAAAQTACANNSCSFPVIGMRVWQAT